MAQKQSCKAAASAAAAAPNACGWIWTSGKCRKAKRTRPLSSCSTYSIARNACRELGHSESPYSRITRPAVGPRAWSTSSPTGAKTGWTSSGIAAPKLSEANGLSDEDDVDAAGVFLVDLENLSDLAVLPVGGVRPCILEGETVLDDPLTGLLRAGDELLRADD